MPTISCMVSQEATPQLFNSAFAVLGRAGVSAPATLSVNQAGDIVVAQHAGVFGCGATLRETELVTVQPGFVGSTSYQGTLLYRLDSTLYVQPKLEVESGYITPDNYTLVIGYINYPGNNNQLDSSMLIPVYPNAEFRYSRCLLAQDLHAIVQQMQDVASFCSVVQVNGEFELHIQNTSADTLTFTLPVNLLSEQYPATSLDLRLALDTGIALYPGIKFRGMDEVALSNGNIFGPVSRSRFRISLLEINLKKMDPFILNLNISIPAGRTAVLSLVGAGNSSFFGNSIVAD